MTSPGKVAFGLTVVLVVQCLQAQNSSSTVGTTADLSGTTDGTTALNGSTNGGTDLSGTTHGGTTQGPETNTTPAAQTEMSDTTKSESQNNSTTTTTIPSISINQKTSREPLTTAITPKLINLNKNITLQFYIKFLDANFSEELGDKSSQGYNASSIKYHDMLYQVYHDVEPRFQDITIKGFRKGSLIVDYTATFKYDPQQKYDYLHTKLGSIFDGLKSLPGVDNDTLDEVFENNTSASLGDRICDIMECPSGYSCQYNDNAILQCVHKCHVSPPKCLNDGNCVLDINFEPVCRCPTTGGFTYGGEKCEHKAEMLDMSKDNIIAIAAGAGGGVILIFLIIIMVLCCTRSSKAEKKDDKVKDDASEQSFKSMKDSEDGLHQAYNGKVNPAMSEPSFRFVKMRSDSKVSQQLRQEPYVVSSASLQPNSRNPRDIVDSYADYRYQGSRGPVEKMEMRRQSRVRVADDIEINPDYGRFSSSARPRDSVDIGSPYRKNSMFNYLAQRRRSSAPTDWRGSKVTQNPLFTVPANRRKSSVYMEIDDNDTKSVMYQPATNVDHPTRPGQATNTIDHPLRQGQQVKVYDYYNRKESVASAVYPRPRAASNADLYDFDEDNSPMRPVYGVRRIQQGPNSPRRF
ncbi:unnamed protein product [Lymnaea stagnalis]|uniref:SEA domain-containing protein n=1 Tax=Lymnaea stagnalis TaxID=6523 RepID=A0AAV2HYP8_LYMST